MGWDGPGMHLRLVAESDTGGESDPDTDDVLSPDTAAGFSSALDELGVGGRSAFQRARGGSGNEPAGPSRAAQMGRPHMVSHHRSQSAGTIPSELARTASMDSVASARATTTFHHHHHHIHHTPSTYSSASLPRRSRSRASLLSLDPVSLLSEASDRAPRRKEGIADEEGGTGRALPLPCSLAWWRGGKYTSRPALWRVLAIGIGLVAVLHAAFCGLLFFKRYPAFTTPITDLWDDLEPDVLHSEARMMVQSELLQQRWRQADDKVKLIPKIIHQTYKTNVVPTHLMWLVRTWREFNPRYEIRFYDDAACDHFVATEFPEYYEAYLSLPKDVERADFFRYMVVLRHGGVYADIDTECRKPIDDFVRASDTLVVGWENEFATDDEAYARHFVRRRQILQWLFMGVPGHPVLRAVCDHVASKATVRFSNNTNRDTLERTGPGIWTDLLLQRSHSQGQTLAADDPWGVRILPRVAFGAHPSGVDGVDPHSPGVYALHHFMGSWKKTGGWQQSTGIHQLLAKLTKPWAVKAEEASPAAPAGGAEDKEPGGSASMVVAVVAGEDPVTAAAAALEEHPTAVALAEAALHGAAALVEAEAEVVLEKADPHHVDHHFAVEHGQDAGWHFNTLGSKSERIKEMVTDLFPVSAVFDPPFDVMVLLLGEDGPADRPVSSSAPFRSMSSSLTNWGSYHPGVHPSRRPGLAEALVGSLGGFRRSAVLVDVGAGVGFFALAAAARGHRSLAFETSPKHLRALRTSVARNRFQELITVRPVQVGAASPSFCATWNLRVEVENLLADDIGDITTGGFSAAMLDGVVSMFGAGDTMVPPEGAAERAEEPLQPAAAGSGNNNQPLLCTRAEGVTTLDVALPPDLDVGAIRISADGLEGWVLEGAAKLMASRPPPIVVLELRPAAMQAAGWADPALVLQRMWAWGYTDISHSGPACDRRWWRIALAGVKRKQPTWCKLPHAMFSSLVHQASATVPETVLFHHLQSVDVEEQVRLARLALIEHTLHQQEQSGGVAAAAAARGSAGGDAARARAAMQPSRLKRRVSPESAIGSR